MFAPVTLATPIDLGESHRGELLGHPSHSTAESIDTIVDHTAVPTPLGSSSIQSLPSGANGSKDKPRETGNTLGTSPDGSSADDASGSHDHKGKEKAGDGDGWNYGSQLKVSLPSSQSRQLDQAHQPLISERSRAPHISRSPLSSFLIPRIRPSLGPWNRWS